MNNTTTSKTVQSNNIQRVFVDVTTIHSDIIKAMYEDGLTHEESMSRNVQEYIREEILGPWLEYRLHIKKSGKPAPTLSQFLKQHLG